MQESQRAPEAPDPDRSASPDRARGAAPPAVARSEPGERQGACLVLLLLLLIATAAVRWRLLDAPMERDEGEYAYVAQLLLRGEPPYGAAHNMKLPGIYLAYAAVLACFGETLRGVHTGLLVANALAIVFLFLLGRRLLGAWGALAAATVFAALAVSEGVQGPFANAEHFVLVPALAGLWLLARQDGQAGQDATGGRARALQLAAGAFLLGCAFVVKQHGIGFGLAGGLWLLWRELRSRTRPRAALARLGLFALAFALPYGLVCLWLWLAGVFESFWFWTVTYAREYTGERPWSDFARNLRGKGRYVARAAPWLWALAGLGLSALAWDRRARRSAALLLLLALFGFLATTPGFHFRPHYFVLLLPAAALFAGALVSGLGRLLARRLPPALAAGLAALPLLAATGEFLWRQRLLLFRLPPALVTRLVFGDNPFPESPAIANFVREATEPGDRVAILGSEPQLWFYADRRGASGYVYVYALVEDQPFALEMQRDMIRQLEETRAEILVFVRVGTSWLVSERAPKELLEWIGRELASYRLVAAMPVGVHARLLRGPALEAWARSPERPKDGVVEIYRRVR